MPNVIFYYSTFDMSVTFALSNTIYRPCWNKTFITSYRHMPKLLILSNFSTSNLKFATMALDVIEDIDDSRVFCGAEEYKLNF